MTAFFLSRSHHPYLKALAVLFLICLSLFSQAQRSDIGNWFIYVGNQPFAKKKWNLWNEVQYRNYNVAGDLEQLILRTGVGRNLTANNNNLLLGYAYIQSEPYVPGTDMKRSTREHRVWQQFITRQQFGRVFLQHRYRLEQRFLQEDFRMRFRYFLALNVPVNKPGMDPGAFYVSAYNEFFLHFDKPVFDRDRIYAAMGYVLKKDLRMEVGIMSQVQETRSRSQFQVVLFNNLSFLK